MNKRKKIIFIDSILYIIFATLYSSKGFALMLAEETTRAHVVYDKYGKSYSYLIFKPISPILYKVGAWGVIITSIIFIALVICKSVKENNKELSKYSIVKKYGMTILIAIICALILYTIPSILENNFFAEVGTEGVYFELW